uniref:Chibby 1, beta catenin antagonist n=1 Tax=Strigops habroptila TaxID=2489341 RepID=A0A672TR25_STRHB
ACLSSEHLQPKEDPPRKCASLSNLSLLDRSTREIELGLEYGNPTMNLWVAASRGSQRNAALAQRNQQLEEETTSFGLKVDILRSPLLLQLSETTAESHLMEKELEELKSHSRRRK